jgi:hypothetical protein
VPTAVTAPTRRAQAKQSTRGNLLSLAIVIGLFAFFLADALPGDRNAFVVFLLTVGAMLVILLVVAAIPLVRRRRFRPSDHGLVMAQLAMPRRQRDTHPVEVFVRATHQLLAAAELLPESDRILLTARLLSFVEASPADRMDVRAELLKDRASKQVSPELRKFLAVTGGATPAELHYVARILAGRRDLR